MSCVRVGAMELGRDSRIFERLPVAGDVLLAYSAWKKSLAAILDGEDSRFLASNCNELSRVGGIDTLLSPGEPAAAAP